MPKDTSKQEKKPQLLEVKNLQRTFLHHAGKQYSVFGMPAEMFDAWVRQYVEEIVNVDVTEWQFYHRWNIINELLEEGLLVISGDTLELPPEVSTSEKEVVSHPLQGCASAPYTEA